MKQIKLLTKKKTKLQKKKKNVPPDSLPEPIYENPHFPYLPMKGLYPDPIAFSCEYLQGSSELKFPPP